MLNNLDMINRQSTAEEQSSDDFDNIQMNSAEIDMLSQANPQLSEMDIVISSFSDLNV